MIVCWLSPYEILKKGLSTSQEISPLSDSSTSPITNIPNHQHPQSPISPITNIPNHQYPQSPISPITNIPNH
ncbi:hypothetical protein, partial [Bartonella sp. AP58NXGY]|uniref:hypothetical protein n=1 Tax=Bartonella sp. AP58NXGY TaxID=3243498 RepID=UPI0035D10032